MVKMAPFIYPVYTTQRNRASIVVKSLLGAVLNNTGTPKQGSTIMVPLGQYW